jgi:hypothetical protein
MVVISPWRCTDADSAAIAAELVAASKTPPRIVEYLKCAFIVSSPF